MPGFQKGFAFIVGVANYPNVRKLPTAVLNDATAIATMLKRPDRGGYADDHVHVLLDKEATRDNILKGLSWLATNANATPNATAIFYFSGHGGHIKDGPDAGNYVIPYDTALREIKKTAISSDTLAAALDKVQTKRVVIIMDACYSAGTVSTKGDLEPDDAINLPTTAKGELDVIEPEVTKGLEEGAFDKLSKGGGRVILASSSSNETSLVLPGAANSLFTTCLLEALDGKAGDKTLGELRILDVTSYVLDQVPVISNGAQNPLFKGTDLSKNFPLALLLGGEKSLSNTSVSAPSMNNSTSTDKHVPKPQTALAGPLTTTQVKKFIVDRLQPNLIDVLCGEVVDAMSEDGLDNTNASSDLFPFDTSTLGLQSKIYPLQVAQIIDHLNRRYKLPYLIYALSKRYPQEKITDWKP